MQTGSCHGPSRAVTRDLPEPPRPVAPEWTGNTRLDPLDGLTGEARRRVHQNNLRIREGDAARYAAYLEEFLLGARRCRTLAEFEAYGKARGPQSDPEPDGTLAERLEFENGPWRRMASALVATGKELDGVWRRLAGKPVPFGVSLDVSVTAKVEAAGRSAGGTWSARGGAAPVTGLTGGGVSVAAKGAHRVDVGVDAGVVGAKATLVGDRVESIEVKARALPGLTVHTKKSAGAIEEAISLGGRVGGRNGAPAIHVEARASVGVNLVTAEFIREALFGKPTWKKRD